MTRQTVAGVIKKCSIWQSFWYFSTGMSSHNSNKTTISAPVRIGIKITLLVLFCNKAPKKKATTVMVKQKRVLFERKSFILPTAFPDKLGDKSRCAESYAGGYHNQECDFQKVRAN